jgi:hypothetical protein
MITSKKSENGDIGTFLSYVGDTGKNIWVSYKLIFLTKQQQQILKSITALSNLVTRGKMRFKRGDRKDF